MYFSVHQYCEVCIDEGWFKQPHLAESDLTLGLGEAAQLLPCMPT